MNTITSTALALAIGASVSVGSSLLGSKSPDQQPVASSQIRAEAVADTEADVRLQAGGMPHVPCDEGTDVLDLDAALDAGLGASVK